MRTPRSKFCAICPWARLKACCKEPTTPCRPSETAAIDDMLKRKVQSRKQVEAWREAMPADAMLRFAYSQLGDPIAS